MGRGGNNTGKTTVSLRSSSEGKRIGELENELLRHKDLYYNGEPEISDAEFDALEEELRLAREANPDLANSVVPDSESALYKVGATTDSEFQPVEHKTPMLSLDKVHTKEDLEKWLDKYPGERFAIWPKFDGVSLSLTYEDGVLVQAASRGDGKIGEDVTNGAKRIVGVQKNLGEKINCEVRGEVVMLKSDFNQYNSDHPEKPLSNPRNAVSGTMRLKDKNSASARARRLHFYAFDIIIDDDKNLSTRLQELGFETRGYAEAESVDEILSYIDDTEASRDSLDYEIDGIVIKIADQKKYHSLGTTSKHPRGAMAMKLAAEIGESEIEGVEWAVGKSGIVAPRAKIKKMFLAGTNISYATLHNVEDIERKGIRVGQRIQIKRAGDVIPFIIGPVQGSEDQGTPIDIPKVCPSCGTDLIEIGDSKILQCPNSSGCPEQASKRLEHWVSRSGADIEGLSAKTLQKLETAGKVQRPSDIYKLDADDIAGLEGMGEKSGDNIIAAIQETKELGLRKALIAWSIPNASEGTAKRLCRAGYESPEDIAAASVEDLSQIEDIGPVVAQSIHDFFADPVVEEEIKELRAAGVNLDTLEADKPIVLTDSNTTELTGKSICLTGTLSVSRGEMKKELEAVGAKPTGSVSKNTDYLLAGENAGSKLAKAESLGVKILTESEARALLS